MIKPMKYIRSWKIRTKLSVLILISAVISISIFFILYKQQNKVWELLSKFPAITWDRDQYINELRMAATNYDVPDSEEDQVAQEAIQPFFATKDKYTGVYVYEIGGKGLYRCGAIPEMTDNWIHGSILDWGYRLTKNEIQFYTQIPMEFHNGEYMVMIYSYHELMLVYPYLIFTLLLSMGLLLGINIFFINRKVKDVLSVKDEILQMSAGDLNHPVPHCGEDEIGVLAEELDHLRITLKEQIQREKESRRANQDLITAMSHDLRTPLTILNGYLEVLKLERVPEIKKTEYLERCSQKINDIKELTDKMFEYALVYEEIGIVHMDTIATEEIRSMLQGNIDYLNLAGFCTEVEMQESSGVIMGDLIMLKRIFNNLFSNVLKYGDKKEAVNVQFRKEDGHLKIIMYNKVKKETGDTESNCIGLKSVEKMVQMHGGDMHVSEEKGTYIVSVILKGTVPYELHCQNCL